MTAVVNDNDKQPLTDEAEPVANGTQYVKICLLCVVTIDVVSCHGS